MQLKYEHVAEEHLFIRQALLYDLQYMQKFIKVFKVNTFCA